MGNKLGGAEFGADLFEGFATVALPALIAISLEAKDLANTVGAMINTCAGETETGGPIVKRLRCHATHDNGCPTGRNHQSSCRNALRAIVGDRFAATSEKGGADAYREHESRRFRDRNHESPATAGA